MKIVFSELEEWEKSIVKDRLLGNELVFIDKPLREEDIEQYMDADIISIFVDSKINRSMISRMPNLKFIATRSTGYDHIDLEACKEYGIVVSNVPRYGENTVAEHAFALLLAIAKNLLQSIRKVEHGEFNPKGLRGIDLKGKTLGVIGTGNIGKNMIRIAKGFGMNVIAYDIHPDLEAASTMGYKYVEFEELLRNSDIISIHVPLLESTRHMINKQNLNLLKRGVIIINTARGGVIDTEALLIGLDKGIISAAGLDVLEGEQEIKEEPQLLKEGFRKKIDYKLLAMDYMLIHHPRVIVTPHNAFNTAEALQRILFTTIDNIKSFIEGRPINRVI
ncbi:hydroxyacid dehydrogenase [Candidatus Woesearchaeota archaeon]|nr:hydroxyacid dehydrogenase [Candidatus Woesearchaeota archaeon]